MRKIIDNIWAKRPRGLSWLTNPFYIYILSFVIVFAVYSLRWSKAFPSLTTPLIVFFLATFIVAFLLAPLISKRNSKASYIIKENRFNLFIIIAVLIGYSIELIYNGGIPIIQILTRQKIEYTQFGIPTFHVFLHTFASYYVVYLFQQFLSTRSKKILLYCVIMLVPHLLVLNRGSLVMVLMAMLFVYLFSVKKIKIKLVFALVVFVLVFFYAFGYIGNMRSMKGNKYALLKYSKASEKFVKGPIPKEYFWTYAYIASPMANFQHNVIYNSPDPTILKYCCLVKNCLLPDFIGKRLPWPPCNQYIRRAVPNYTVATVYTAPYCLVGWPGAIILFLFGAGVTLFYLKILNENSKYYVSGLAILLTVTAFNAFDNMWIFTGLSLQLIYPLLAEFLENRKRIVAYLKSKW